MDVTDSNPWIFRVFVLQRKAQNDKKLSGEEQLFVVEICEICQICIICDYLFEPALIIAQRKPMVAVAESWAMKRRVPGESQ